MKEKLLGDVVTANEFSQLLDDSSTGCIINSSQSLIVSKLDSTNRTVEIIDDMIEVINEEIEKLNSHKRRLEEHKNTIKRKEMK